MNRESGYIPRQTPEEARRIQELWKKGADSQPELDALVDSFVANRKREVVGSDDLDEQRFRENAARAKENSDHGRRKLEQYRVGMESALWAARNDKRTLAHNEPILKKQANLNAAAAEFEKAIQSNSPSLKPNNIPKTARKESLASDPTIELPPRPIGANEPTVAFFDDSRFAPQTKPKQSKKKAA